MLGVRKNGVNRADPFATMPIRQHARSRPGAPVIGIARRFALC